MKHIIMIHVSPHEIDQYQTFIHNLRRSLDILSKDDLGDLLFIPYLNLSQYLYNWNKSHLPKEFFVKKFNSLNSIISKKIEIESGITNFEKEIQGALSYKAEYIRLYKDRAKSYIWFDCDIWFSNFLLITLLRAYDSIPKEIDKFIITPQIVRLWDTTWDIITNDLYLNRKADHETYLSFDPFELLDGEYIPELIENTGNIKFASGWGNMLSSGLFNEKISLDKLGHYGVDDTYIMYAMDILKQKGENYKQFILKDIVVTENNLWRENFYSNVIEKARNCKFKEEMRAESENNMLIKLALL